MSAFTTVQQPPVSFDMVELSEKKRKLVDEMSEFTKEGDRVNPTDSQLRLADELVRNDDRTRYKKIPFGVIVHYNDKGEGSMDMMMTAFDVLFRYTVNMLKLKRPRNWHTIKFTNTQFKARADCMIGTRDILRIMGYTKPTYAEQDGRQNGLSYPNPSQVSQDSIKLVGAELLTAKIEIKIALENNKRLVPQYIPGPHYDFLEDPDPPNDPDGMYESNINSHASSGQYSSSSFGQASPVDSYHMNSSQTGTGSYGSSSLQYHSSFEHPDNHRQPNLSQMPISHHYRDQYDHQLRNQGSRGYDHRSNQDMAVEDVEDVLNISNSSDMGAKLEELKKKKADIKKIFAPDTSDIRDSTPAFISQPHHNKPTSTMTMPIMTLDEKPRAPPVPKPRRNRPPSVNQPPLSNPPPIQEEESHPPNNSDVAPLANQGGPGPGHRPQVAPRQVKFMMECDFCNYLNHEKFSECVVCQNPRNERWRKVPLSRGANMPSPSLDNPPPAPETPSVVQSNNPSFDRPTVVPPNTQHVNQPPSDTPTAATNAQFNNQPHAAAPTGAVGGGGGAGASVAGAASNVPLKEYVPPKKYTDAEKEEMKRKCMMAQKVVDMAEKKEQHYGSEEKRDEGFQSYLPHNDNYNWDGWRNGGVKQPIGNVLQESKMTGPEDTELYRSLAQRGQLVIQDIKEGLRRGYRLEEIRVATELQHGHHTSCDFLSREWNSYIERTMFLVRQLSDEEHRKRKMTGSIGNPKRGEIVQFLIEENGNYEKAAQKCCACRLKMIQELMREVGLPQAEAVRALENNGLNVNKAIHAIYRDKINNNALYEHMWGKLEGGGIRQKENERVEKMITEGVYKDYYLQQLLMAEYKLPAAINCNVLIELVRAHGLTLGACLDVAKVNANTEDAKKLLIQECPICGDEFTRNEMVNMINCNHAVCKDCFLTHFSIMIGEKSIKHYNCPVCGEPDLTSEAIDVDLYLQLFSGLIQVHMKKEEYDLFTQKINEHTMMKDPNFRWCVKCSTGFINEARMQKMECPNVTCQQKMCFRCKKPWEDQHQGLTCEQFAEWKKDNDPELQAQGLAAYLNEEGIECPSCGFKYALAKGGCMHFRCGQCPAEFCSGCNNLFRKDCTKFESCRKKGLHAHHPRDCLFFLRDESVENLQKLLTNNNVEFNTEPPQGQVNAQTAKEIQALQGQQAAGGLDAQLAPPVAAAPALQCRVMLQKETPEGPPIDEECGSAVESGHAGLCEKHYKEYLVFKVNENHLDPLPLFDTGPLTAILAREEMKVPDQQAGEGEEQYAERLRQFIKDNLPLQERAVTNF